MEPPQTPPARATLQSLLGHPRWFTLPFLTVVFFILLGSLETSRTGDRWTSICFVLCSFLLFFHHLPARFPHAHPAGQPGGECWTEVCDVLAAETIAGY